MSKKPLILGVRREKSTTITARVRISLYEQLKQSAEDLNVTISTFLAELCESAVDPDKGEVFTKKQLEEAIQRASFNVSDTAPEEVEYLEYQVRELQSRCDAFEAYCKDLEQCHKNAVKLYKDEVFFPKNELITPKLKRP